MVNDEERISLAVWGLANLAEELNEALFGRREKLRRDQYEQGPAAKAFGRLARIAAGADFEREAARRDMEYVLPLFDLLRGSYANATYPIIQKARLRIVGPSDLITYKEVAEIMGVATVNVDLDIDCKLLHPIIDEDYKMYFDRQEVKKLMKARNQ